MSALTPELQTLLKRIVSTSQRFPLQNFKEYFTKNAEVTFNKFGAQQRSAEEIKAFTEKMTKHAEVLERQTAINQLYHIDHLLVRR